MKEILIGIDGLYFGNAKEGKWILKDINFNIFQGKILGLLGPNGAGKTTLLRILMQMMPAHQGSIYYQKEILQEKDMHLMGYLPEERGLYPLMSIREQVIYFGRLRGLKLSTILKNMNFWFDRLEVSDWQNKKIKEVSYLVD